MEIAKFLESLKVVAASPYALVGYLALVAAWLTLAIYGQKIRAIGKLIKDLPERDRLEILKREYHTTPRAGLTADQWIRSRKHAFIFFAFLALVVGAIVLVLAALARPSKDDTLANRNLAILATNYSGIQAALTTNSSLDPKIRAKILEHSPSIELVSPDASDFEKWKRNFKNEQAEADRKELAGRLRHERLLAEQKATAQVRIDRTWDRARQLYDFIIRTLQIKIQGVAEDRGEKVSSNYTGLPAAIGTDKIIRIGTITTGTNLGWRFEISAEAIHRGAAGEVYLRVIGTCPGQGYVHWLTALKTSENAGNPVITNVVAESGLSAKPNVGPDLKPFNFENYQTDGLVFVQKFIGAIAVGCEGR
jgi:hypothetical protein